MPKRVMLDLETLGVNSHAPVVSIGAVMFDADGVNEGSKFYAVLDVGQQIRDHGREVDGDTVRWWTQQSEAARSVFKEPRHDTDSMLDEFAGYLRLADRDTVEVWGNGSDFDNVILANLFDAVGHPRAWRFTNNRCYRTMRSLVPAIVPAREGTHHNALDDAVYQARIAAQMLSRLKSGEVVHQLAQAA